MAGICGDQNEMQTRGKIRNFDVSWLHHLMEKLASSGPLTVERVSEKLGMSCRTLQRRLSEHDLTFRDMLAHVRLEMAVELLRETDLPVPEIADRLGCRKPGAFSRDFVRWTDPLPSAYRKRDRGKRLA